MGLQQHNNSLGPAWLAILGAFAAATLFMVGTVVLWTWSARESRALAAPTAPLPANEDTTVGDNGLIAGTYRNLLVGNDLRDGNGREYALLRFDVSSIPPNARVGGVTLKVRGSYARSPYAGHVVRVAVYPAAGPWDETTVRQPGPGYDSARPLGAMDVTYPGSLIWHEVSTEELRKLVQEWVSGQRPNHGLALVAEGIPDDVDTERGFWSKDCPQDLCDDPNNEDGLDRFVPRLIVNYTVPTPKPSLILQKVATPAGAVGFGERVTYTLAYRNPWHQAISDVEVTDTLPDNMRLVGATPAPAATPRVPATWSLGTLNSGDGGTITVIAETITRTWAVNLTETWTARFEEGQVQDLQVTYTLPVTLKEGWDATDGVSVTLALDARLRAQQATVIPSDVLVAVVNTDDGATVTARPTSLLRAGDVFTVTVLACYWGDANTGPRRENEVWLDDGLATQRMVSRRSEALDTYSLIAKSCPDSLRRNPLPAPVPTVEARWRNAARISGRADTTTVEQWSNMVEHSAQGYRTGLIYLPVVGR